MRTRTWVLAFACASGLVAAAPRGGAKPNAKAITAPLVVALDGGDDEAAAKAAAALGELSDPAAHEALLDALAWGLRAPVAVEALTALAKHPAPPDVASLKRYATHHDPTVRGHALAELARYPDPAAHAAVVQGLHDPAGAVRAAAATAAAKARVREAIEPLFALLARGEESAARALAAMADADLVRKLGDQLGRVPDASLALCLGLVLRRPDFGPDAARVEVVRAIGKIADPSAVDALTDYLDATPKNPPRASRAEAEKMVEARLAGGAK